MLQSPTGEGAVNSALTRGYGTLAGLGFVGAALLAVPSTLLLDPTPPAENYLATVGALFTGLVCMSLPWERMDQRWLHAVGALATAETAVGVALFGQAYVAIYFLVAIAAAYVTAEPKPLLVHLGLIGLALFGPLVYGPAEPRETLHVALVTYPLLILTAGTFAYVRSRMVADHRSYRLFAEETLALATRIAGRPLAPGRTPDADEPLPAFTRLRVSTRASTVGACVLAVPLLTAGLAGAGVRLPEFASDGFADIGLDLPNQEQSDGEASAASLEPEPDAPLAGRGMGEGAAMEESAGAASSKPRNRDSQVAGPEAPAGAGDQPGASDKPASRPATDGAEEAPRPSEAPQVPPEPAGPLEDALEDTLSGLGEVLAPERGAPDPPAGGDEGP
jgi:hypothetical protein